MIINEMAFSKSDAIDKCIELGHQFIDHFHKVYKENQTSYNYIHHCNEMQSWLDECRKILIDTNHCLIGINLLDWFFTAGECIDSDTGFIDNNEIEFYNKFILLLALDRNSKIIDVLNSMR